MLVCLRRTGGWLARATLLDPAEPGTIVALLGPTNTGKTHVAVQRMLAHGSGIIGLPLRLLAREVYDRVVREAGVDAVALVTGEEKRVPLAPSFWVCTVESMPMDRPVAFLAVDEVQLAGDPARGHVFTDRILNARGVAETWFLGSDTIEPLLRTLVPTVEVRRQPRLSRLSWAGARKLTSLPPRTAVVTFSVRAVYELADRLRARHGGAAVVLGALSPRARNAQVEMYTSGEVQHMVATDAIGMGLNLDVHHVALAAAHKFDGREHRELRDDELAQIAGRAGRFRRDGTFGVTAGLEPFSAERVEALEQHSFPPLRRLYWRNSELSFDTVDALVESLLQPAPRRFLRAVHDADDARALRRLLLEDSVRERARGREAVQLLWEVARVPDFGHTLTEHHATLLAQIYTRLVDGQGHLPEDWLGEQVRRIDRTQGDIATLTSRIAAIRIWTYLVNRGGWLSDPAAWRDRTRAVEDRLSDALHARLTLRFVDRRAAVLIRGLASGEDPVPVLGPGGRVQVSGEALGVLRGLRFEAAHLGTSAAMDRAVRRLLRPLLADRLEDLEGSPDSAFGLDPEGGVRWDGARVAQLLPGPRWQEARLRPLRHDSLESPQRSRLARRLDRWFASWRSGLTAELDALDADSHAMRALLHGLRQGMGFCRRHEVVEAMGRLTVPEQRVLGAAGVVPGERWVLMRRLVERVRERAVLLAVHEGSRLELPDDGGRLPFEATLPATVAPALGFERVRGTWVRVDTMERILAGEEVHGLPREQAQEISGVVRRWRR